MRFSSSKVLVALLATLAFTSLVKVQGQGQGQGQQSDTDWLGNDSGYEGDDSDEPPPRDVPLVPQVFKITNLLRTVDLSKPIVREVTSVAILNIGTESVTDYYFPLDSGYLKNLAFIKAENRKTKEPLEMTRDPKYHNEDYQYYHIKLSAPLPPNEKTQITVTAHFTNLVRPFPTHVKQGERQQFSYFGNSFALTAYPAAKQKTTIVAPTSTLEILFHLEENVPTVTANQVVLGPFTNVEPLEHGIFEVQYQLPGPLPHVRHLRRDIEISHWGNNLAVEEHYNLINRGALLEGQFNRLDYMRNPVTLREGNMITAFRAEIPKLARDIYYRDEIGNISTSAILHQPDNILLTFKPRFPIFGGWNTTWYMGYNAPLNEYLRRVPGTDKYILKFPAVVPLAQTSYTDIDIRIILPEGAKNVNVQLPYEVDAVENSTTKTYMDSAGRHTVTIYAHNLIEEHGRLEMLVEYEYSASSYLIKPFAAASMLMVIFATSMVFSRLDFRIGQSVLKK